MMQKELMMVQDAAADGSNRSSTRRGKRRQAGKMVVSIASVHPEYADSSHNCFARESMNSKSLQQSVVWWLAVVQLDAYTLSMQLDGCRVVQAALEAADSSGQEHIVEQLHGHVDEMVKSPHGNHVLQRIIEVMPPATAIFILDEIRCRWDSRRLATHRFGCRVLERMIEHFLAWSVTRDALIEFLEDLLVKAAGHCYHQFAAFVMQHLMEHGPVNLQLVLVDAVSAQLEDACLHTYASGVTDRALTCMPLENQRQFATDIMEIDGLFVRMVLAGKPAAERLSRVVTGQQFEEMVRALCDLLSNPATRARAVRFVHTAPYALQYQLERRGVWTRGDTSWNSEPGSLM